MGSRGPIAKSGGVRAERARKRKRPTPPGSTPERPAWLPEDAAAVWDAVLCDLQDAGVIVARIDAHSIAMFALTIQETAKAAAKGDTKTAARFGRDLLQWAGAIGATPAARLRMAIQPQKPADDDDPWAKLALDTGIPELNRILAKPRGISKVTDVKQ